MSAENTRFSIAGAADGIGAAHDSDRSVHRTLLDGGGADRFNESRGYRCCKGRSHRAYALSRRYVRGPQYPRELRRPGLGRDSFDWEDRFERSGTQSLAGNACIGAGGQT